MKSGLIFFRIRANSYPTAHINISTVGCGKQKEEFPNSSTKGKNGIALQALSDWKELHVSKSLAYPKNVVLVRKFFSYFCFEFWTINDGS